MCKTPFAMAVVLAICPTFPAFSAGLEVSARSALVLDGQGNVLFERNANRKLPNASTTKILTALVVIDNAALEDVVTVSSTAAKAPPSRMGLQRNERYTVLELLYALLLVSANDAAIALAEHVAGSQARFSELLNSRAKSLGAQNTHFVTPNGLHANGHYSTAKDLALFIRTAMQSPIFVAIAQTHTVDLVWPGNHGPHRLTNSNKLLTSFDHPVLGKTGFTYPAGRCYVAATQDSLLTVVMLGSRNLWRDARRMVEWGLKATSGRMSDLRSRQHAARS